MKKLVSIAGSFVLGFFFFAAGGAVAIETSGVLSQNDVVANTQESVSVTETYTNTETGGAENSSAPETSEPGPGTEGDVYCFQIGKATELDDDCFCVQDMVNTMEEVNCLIASGVVPASSYEIYRQIVFGESE